MILRTEAKDYGGMEVWDDRQPDSPIYLAPHLSAYYSGSALTALGEAFVDGLITARIEAVTLDTVKADKVAALDAWYESQAAGGVTVGAITLPASVADQNRYTSLAAMEHLALSLGQRQLTDASGLADINGEWHTLPLADLFGLLLQYGAACAAWSAHYAEVLAAIHAAESIEAVEAIEV